MIFGIMNKIINPLALLLCFRTRWRKLTSALMKCALRIMGAKIGKDTFISSSSRIVCTDVIIGNDCKILDNVTIYAKRIRIGDGCIISANAYISGTSDFIMGSKSYIGKETRINLSREVIIGEDVGVGENTTIWTHGYWHPADEGYPIVYAPVTIKDKAWISTNITILPGITVGVRATIGAGSLVTKDVPDGVVVVGNPAKVIKQTDELKSEKSFIEILERIFDEYEAKKRIGKENRDSFLKYSFPKFSLYILENCSFNTNDVPKKKKIIFMYKDIPRDLEDQVAEFNWFNFNKKIRKKTNYKEVLKIHDFLRSYGIRFLIDYTA